MKCKMQTAELSTALSTAARAIPARPVQAAMNGVLMEAKSSSVTLTASSGKLTIRAEVSAWVDEEGSAVLPGNLFSDLARKLPGDEVSVELDGATAKIRCGKNRSQMSVIPVEDFPDGGAYKALHTVSVPCGRLKAMIAGTVFAATSDESRLALTGISVIVKDGHMELAALDGFRLALTRMGNVVGDFSTLVPAASMRELASILPETDEACEIRVSEKDFTAAFGATTLTAVTLNTPFVEYSKLIPGSFVTEALVSRGDMLGAVGRTELVARGGHNNLIRLQVADGKCSLSSRAEIGEVVDEVDAETVGKDQTIAFNAKYLTEAIKSIGTDEVVMKANLPVAPVVFVPKDDDNALYLVLPVKTA